MGYGIGRVPTDVDPGDEAVANLRAVEIMAQQERRQEMARCPACGRVVPRILMMAASLETVCDRCYDDYSD